MENEFACTGFVADLPGAGELRKMIFLPNFIDQGKFENCNSQAEFLNSFRKPLSNAHWPSTAIFANSRAWTGTCAENELGAPAKGLEFILKSRGSLRFRKARHLMNLKTKSNEELIRELKLGVEKERELLMEILHLLREVDFRKLHLQMGYPDLYTFAIKELGNQKVGPTFWT